MNNTFYITTPIYYVNDVPHIGHAYTTVAADVLARHYGQWGYDVFFLTGVDEHGQKVQQAAAKAGIDPKLYCDGMVPRFQELWKRLNISNDAFIRTTDAGHKAIVQQYLEQLYNTTDDKNERLIYSADYTGWYCTFDERFWTEKDVTEGLCPDCKRPVEKLSEKNYFFKMSLYQQNLQRHILNHHNPPDPYIGPESRCNEVIGFLKKPLEDLSISRPKSRLSWGIELPFDPNYVTYVWFDALVNYISALTYLTPQSKHDPKASLQHYWRPQPSGTDIHKVVHLVGKDILTTHAVYWSTMLMALNLPLPTTIYAHGWWTVNGEKMSKSRGNVVDPNSIVDEFGVDAFRYFLLREVPFGQDGDFSKSALIGRINSELADGLGNLLSRTLTMIERFCGGRIPEARADVTTLGEAEFLQATGKLNATAKDHIEQLRFNRALEAIWEILLQHCDQYIEKNAPWKLAKKPEDKPKLEKVLFNVACSIAFSIRFLYPFMPNTALKIARQLGLEPQVVGRRLVLNELTPGTEIAKGNPLFPRIETPVGAIGTGGAVEPKLKKGDTRVTDQPVPAPSSASASPTATPVPAAQQSGPTPTPAPTITIDDFVKVQLKTAVVLSAERVPNSEKLIKLQVDLGTEKRQIVAGIGKKYEPDVLLGKRIVIVANLQPRKLMGLESQGMVLAAGDANVEGLITVLEEVAPGVKVK
ncbi:methionine--tRNA ligase [Nitrospira sp. Nam74]